MKTILAPVDFSPATDGVVAEAARLALALDARVVLLAVVSPPALPYDYAPILENIAEITAAGEKAAARQLARLEDALRAQSVAVESVQLVGPPTRLIADQAEKSGAHYIVMGSHGHTAFYDLLVGSTTHGVLMRAKCPVVIVPAAKEKKRSERRSAGGEQPLGVSVPPPEAL